MLPMTLGVLPLRHGVAAIVTDDNTAVFSNTAVTGISLRCTGWLEVSVCAAAGNIDVSWMNINEGVT